jgi:hypothetical protein
MQMKTNMEHWWNDTDRGKETKVLGEEHFLELLRLPQISWTGLGSKPDLRGERFATIRLCQDATLEHPN